jgi:hypothetical protein
VSKLGKQPKKSILKNSIRIPASSVDSTSKIDDRATLNAIIVKNVEGKAIRNSSLSIVKFRSSKIDPLQFPLGGSSSKTTRKSCLKQSNFGLNFGSKPIPFSDQVNTPRSSRSQSFLRLKNEGVDGKLLSKSDGMADVKERIFESNND